HSRRVCDLTVSLLLLLALLPAVPVHAEPDELMPGSIVTVDARRSILKFVARPTTGTFDLPDDSPVTFGARIEFFDTVAPGPGANVLGITPLTPFGWRQLADGWSYRSHGQPCRARVKSTVVAAACRFKPTLSPPFSGDVQVVMTIGAKRYCATFGGTTVADR